MTKLNNVLSLLLLGGFVTAFGQDSTDTYKKRVLETSEIAILSSYYSQDGDNSAVSGGLGSEELTDATAAIIVSIPLD